MSQYRIRQTSSRFIASIKTMAGKAQITIYRGSLEPGQHVWSPYVIKLETRLRMAGISYKTAAGSPKTAPRGKIPYVDLQQNGETTQIGDSTLIVKHLMERGLVPDLNGKLSAEKRAEDMGLRALLEDKLYFYHVSSLARG